LLTWCYLRLRSQAPDLAVVSARLAQRLQALKVPFRHRCSVANAEESKFSRYNFAIVVFHIRVLDPGQAIYTAILSAAQDRLLEPGAIQWVPDLDIAIGSTYRKA
jgi:hypothetical protein